MKVQCISNSGSQLDPSNYELGYTPSSEFPLRTEKIYVVASLSVWRSRIHCLVRGELNVPIWVPVELFEIVDDAIPSSWQFRFYGYGGYLNALFGYAEIIDIENNHYDRLLESVPLDVQIFEERLSEYS